MKCNAVELEDNKACFTAKVSPLSGQKTGRLARDFEGKTSYTPLLSIIEYFEGILI
jgi:hypothetical protein